MVQDADCKKTCTVIFSKIYWHSYNRYPLLWNCTCFKWPGKTEWSNIRGSFYSQYKKLPGVVICCYIKSAKSTEKEN